jgi:hypothetical protein
MSFLHKFGNFWLFGILKFQALGTLAIKIAFEVNLGDLEL